MCEYNLKFDVLGCHSTNCNGTQSSQIISVFKKFLQQLKSPVTPNYCEFM